MKMNKMLTLVCGLALGSHLAAQQPRYELIWQEDFNGSTFDEKYWTKIPRGNADWCRHMSDEPSLYEVKDGNLILRGKVNDGIVPQDTARYITGGLYTKDKKGPQGCPCSQSAAPCPGVPAGCRRSRNPQRDQSSRPAV